MANPAPSRHPHAAAPPRYTAQTSVQLTPEIKQRADAMAEEHRVSVSEILRRAIDAGIDQVEASFTIAA